MSAACGSMEGTDLIVEELTTVEALERLRPEWTRLFAQCPRATAFQSPEWLLAWWRHLGGGELFSLALRDRDSRLVGFAPLFLWEHPAQDSDDARAISSPPASRLTRDLLFIGTGITDYADVLALPGDEAAVAQALLRHLDLRRGHWRLCDLQALPEHSPLLLAAVNCPEHLVCDRQFADVCPAAALPATWDEHLASLTAVHRRNWRTACKRVAQAGEVRFEQATGETLDECMDSLFELHAACWRERGEAGVLADARVQDFHAQAARDMLGCEALRLYVLRLDHRIVAAQYNFVAHRKVYAYLAGYDPARRDLSLGTLMVGHAIGQAIQEGLTEFDFLRGRESYKYLWGARDRNTCRLRLRPRTVEPA